MRLLTACALVALNLSLPVASGQDPVPARSEIPLPQDAPGVPLPLTLEDALRLGARSNTTLRINELLPLQAAQDVRGARAIFEPELYGDASAAHSSDPTRNVFQPESRRDTYSGRLGLRQLVPSGGLFDLAFAPVKLRQSTSIPGFPTQLYTAEWTASYTQPLLRGAWTDYTLRDVHSLEAARAASEYRYGRVVQDTLQQIVQAYWDLVFARESYLVAHQALELALEQLGRTEQKIKVGELAPLDRVADQAEVARRREELVTAENDIRDREDDLRRLLFDDADGRLWARSLQPITPIGEFPERTAHDWRELGRVALHTRPDLRARRADVAVAEVALTAAERDMLPKLDLVGGYTTDSTREHFGSAWAEARDFEYDDWSVSLQLSLPIGNGAALAVRERARLEVERVKRVLYAAELDVTLEVRDAVRRLATLAEAIVRGRESVRLAETNLSREVARRDAGASTSFEVQQRNQELQEARSRLLRNQLDYRIAEVGLLWAQGLLEAPRAEAPAPPAKAGEGTQ